MAASVIPASDFFFLNLSLFFSTVNHLFRILFSAILLLTCLPLPARKTAVPDSDNGRKAEYIFLEGANMFEPESLADYYMMMRRAAALSTGDAFIQGTLAEQEVLLARDSLQLDKAYRKLQRRFYSAPLVQHNADVYIGLAMNIERFDDAIAAWQMLDSLQPNRNDPAINLARAYYTKGMRYNDSLSLVRALEIHRRLQQAQPGSIALATYRFKVLGALNDTAALIADARELRRAAPANADVAMFCAQYYNALGMKDTAMACLDRAVALAPDNGLARRMRAAGFLMGGDSAAYCAEMERALASPSMDVEVKSQMMADHLQIFGNDSTQTDSILNLFRILGENNPGEASVHTLYGQYLLSLERFADAAEQLSYAVELYPESDRDVWEMLVFSFVRSGNSDSQLKYARMGVERYPDDLYCGVVGASVLEERKETAAALALLDSLDLQAPGNAKMQSEVHLFKSNLLYEIEMPDSALTELDRAIFLNAENHMALNNAAYFMAELGRDLERAGVYASIACAAEPENPTFLDTYAWVMFRKGEYARALELIDRALAVLDKPRQSAEEANGEAGREEYAEPDAAAGEEADEGSVEIYDHAGDIYFMNGQTDRAVELWRKALEYEPDSAKILLKVRQRHYQPDEN